MYVSNDVATCTVTPRDTIFVHVATEKVCFMSLAAFFEPSSILRGSIEIRTACSNAQPRFVVDMRRDLRSKSCYLQTQC